MIDNQTVNPSLPTIENAATFFEKAEAFITKYKLGSIITTATTAIASTGAAIASGTLSVPMTAFIAFAAVAIAATIATIAIIVIAKRSEQGSGKYGLNPDNEGAHRHHRHRHEEIQNKPTQVEGENLENSKKQEEEKKTE